MCAVSCLGCGELSFLVVAACAVLHFSLSFNAHTQNWLMALGLHAGRDMVLFGAIVHVDAPAIKQSPWVAAILLGWASTELVRYAFYALNVQQMCPYILKWLRYTYPVLVFPVISYVEVYTEYLALPIVAERGLLSTEALPNALNFEIRGEYVLGACALVQALVTPMFFLNLWRMRTKALAAPPADAKATASSVDAKPKRS